MSNVDSNCIRSGDTSSPSSRARYQSQIIFLSSLGPFDPHVKSCRQKSCVFHTALGVVQPSQSSRRKRGTAEVDLGWKTVPQFVSWQPCEFSANLKRVDDKHPMPSSHRLQCETRPAAQDHCEEGASFVPRGPDDFPAPTAKARLVINDLAKPVHDPVAAIGTADGQRQRRSRDARCRPGVLIPGLSNSGSYHERAVATKYLGP